MSAPKASGSRPPSVCVSQRFFPVTRRILNSGPQNSAMTCRQTPQGAASPTPSVPPVMAMAENRLTPSLTALKNAVRSAQTVAP